METQSKLIVDLPFKEFVKKEEQFYVMDQSGSHHDCLISGNSSIIPDDRFGSCLHLATPEDRLNISGTFDLMGDFYLELWIKPESAQDQVILHLSQTERNLFLLGYRGNRIWLGILGEQITFDQKIIPQVWTHLGVRLQKTEEGGDDDEVYEVTLYYNGSLAAKKSLSASMFQVDLQRKILQEVQQNHDVLNFLGCMSNLKIYTGTLSQKEIVKAMSAVCSSHSIYQNRFPLDFEFDDDEVFNVLYIANTSDNAQERAEFRVTNGSNSSLMLSPLQACDREHFHFELRFRPNTFEQRSGQVEGKDRSWSYIRATNLPEGWIAGDATIDPVSNYLSIYFSYTGSSELEFKADERITFTMEYFSADGKKGGRSTKVLLLYKEMSYKNSNTPFGGKRLKPFNIINMLGKKNIPIHAGFVGSNTILNDSDPENSVAGTSCSLTLRLRNTLNSGEIRFLTGKESTESNLMTRLTISFDPDDDDLALGTQSELSDIQVSTAGNWANVVRTLQGKTPVFTIDNFKISEFSAGESLDIEITNIQSSKPSGFSCVYLRYENIQGYWDGDFVFVVEKTPIIHRNILSNGKEEQKVGIGTMPEVDYQLKVGGNLRIEPDLDDTHALSIGNKEKTASYFSVDKEGNTGIKVEQSKIDLAIGEPGTGLQSPEAGKLSIQIKDKEKILIDQDRMEVKGRIKDATGYLVPPGTILPFGGPKANIPAGFLPCDGKLVKKEGYPELYQAIGDSWGATDIQFRVPDLRGFFLRGVSDGTNNDPESGSRYSLNKGGSAGDEAGSYQKENLAKHNHPVSIDNSGQHNHKLWTYNGNGVGGKNDNNWVVFNDDGPKQDWKGKTDDKGNHTHNAEAKNTGGPETRPKNAAVWYMIKY